LYMYTNRVACPVLPTEDIAVYYLIEIHLPTLGCLLDPRGLVTMIHLTPFIHLPPHITYSIFEYQYQSL
jgi:hypothetical protein